MAEKNYDVIVVGAGLGGITCAALLAKAGIKTLVLEKNSRIGGKAMSVSVKGFQSEMWPIFGVNTGGGPWVEAFRQLGIESELKVKTASTALMYHPTGGKWNTMVSHPEVEGDPTAILDLLGLKGKDRDSAIQMLAEMATMTPEQLDDLDDISVQEWLARHGDIPKTLYNYFVTWSILVPTGPYELIAMSEFIREMMLLRGVGPSGYPVGGYQRLIDVMAGVIKANGGDIKTRARVERISIEDGKVNGVITSGSFFKAPIVVSNAGVQPTVLKLVGEQHFDRGYVNTVKNIIGSLCFTGVRYILNKKVLPHGIYVIWSEDSYLDIERLNKMRSKQIPDELSIYMVIPSNFDPGMAPPGKQIIALGTWCSADPEAKEIKLLHKKTDEMVAKIFPEIVPAIESRMGYTGPADVSSLSRDSVLPGMGGEACGLGVAAGQTGKHKIPAAAPLRGLFHVGYDSGGAPFCGSNQAVDSGINVAKLVRRYYLERRLTEGGPV